MNTAKYSENKLLCFVSGFKLQDCRCHDIWNFRSKALKFAICLLSKWTPCFIGYIRRPIRCVTNREGGCLLCTMLCKCCLLQNCHLYLCMAPANAIHSANVGLMLGHRLRRWPNIKPALAEWIVFAGAVLIPVDRKLPLNQRETSPANNRREINVGSTTDQCWRIVCDDGPALGQRQHSKVWGMAELCS